MKILLACAAFPPLIRGGGPVSSYLYAKALADAGHIVRCISVQDHEVYEEYNGIPVHRLRSPNIYWDYYKSHPAWQRLVWHILENFNPRAFAMIRREIRSVRPDILATISTENINVATWVAGRAEGVPVAHFIQSHFLMCWRAVMFKHGRNCRSQCVDCGLLSVGKKLLSQLVDGVQAETHFVLDAHRQRGYFPSAIKRVIPGIVNELTPPGLKDKATLRVGYFGAHVPGKGLETLAQAASALASKPRIEFVVAGSGKPELSAQFRALFPPHRASFLGWTQPECFFPKVDVLVVPSIFREAFGRSIIEAFAHGVPVIGARSGGIPETIKPGLNGFTFTPGDAAELGQLIERLADNPRLIRRLSTNAYEDAKHYLPERVGPSLIGFFEDVIAHSTAGRGRRRLKGLEPDPQSAHASAP